jgi:hypothetical protein
MKTIELLGQVDENHRLSALVPNEIPAGPVRLALVVPSTESSAGSVAADEDDAGNAWEHGVLREWSDELADPRQDFYGLNDGEPIVATG